MGTRILPVAFALGTAASAALAEPVVLTETQMDYVTAGGADVVNEPGFFRLEFDEDGTRVSVLMEGHEGLIKYDDIDEILSSHGLVIRTSELSSKVSVSNWDSSVSVSSRNSSASVSDRDSSVSVSNRD